MKLEIPSYLWAEPNVVALFYCQVNNNSGSVSFTVSDDQFFVDSNNILKSRATMTANQYNLTITATDSQSSSTHRVRVDISRRITITSPPSVAINNSDQVELSAAQFDGGQGNGFSFIMMDVPPTLWVKLKSKSFTNDIAILTRSQLNQVILSENADQLARITRSGRATYGIDYWLSTDGGLSYIFSGHLSATTVPCFDGRAVACMGIHNNQMVWKPVPSLRPGDKILDAMYQSHVVTRLIQTKPMSAMMVSLPAHSMGHNRPNRDLCLTTNHRIWAYDRHGNLRNIPAGHLPALWANSGIIHVQKKQIVLYHIETTDYAYILINNIRAETLAQTKRFDHQRKVTNHQCQKKKKTLNQSVACVKSRIRFGGGIGRRFVTTT